MADLSGVVSHVWAQPATTTARNSSGSLRI
jgi:hypothetical protein